MEDHGELMDNSERREGRKPRIAILGSRGIPHTYSGYEAVYRQVMSWEWKAADWS